MLSSPVTERGRSSHSRLNPPNEENVHHIRSCDLLLVAVPTSAMG